MVSKQEKGRLLQLELEPALEVEPEPALQAMPVWVALLE
jgi:hypothetical protein